MKTLKILILTILTSLFGLTVSSQIDYYSVNAGQYVIYNSGASGNVTIERKYTSDGVIAYRNRVDVVDTIMSVLSTTSLDTLSTFTRPSGKKLGISLPDSAHYRDAIAVADDSIVYYTKKTNGNNAVIDGADVIDNFNTTQAVNDTVFDANLDLTVSSTYYNFRQVIPADSITSSGTFVRVAFKAHPSFVFDLDGASIGLRLAGTDDFNGVPTRLTFSNIDSVDIAASEEILSDPVYFPTNVDSTYMVHVYSSEGSPYAYGGAGIAYRTNTVLTDETLTETVNFGSFSNSIRIITRIEVSTPETNIYTKSGITTKPQIVFFGDSLGLKQTSVDSLNLNYEWFWDSVTDSLYVYYSGETLPDVEIGQRGQLVNIGSNNHITFRDIKVQHSNEGNVVGDIDWFGAIDASGGSNLSFYNVTVQKSGYIGAYIRNASDVLFDNCTFYLNGWDGKNGENVRLSFTEVGHENFTFKNGSNTHAGKNGIYITSAVGAGFNVKNVTIEDIDFAHCFDAGVYLQRVDSAEIVHNTFDSCGDPIDSGEDYSIAIGNCNVIDIAYNTITNQIHNDAIQTWSDEAGGASDYVTIRYNFIDGVANGSGIGLNVYDSLTSKNNQIYYNVIANADNYGIHLSTNDTAASVDVFNNTIYGSGIRSIDVTDNFPYVLKNNIMVNLTGAGENISEFVSTSGFTSSNNLWVSDATYVLKYNGNNYTSATITNFEATAQTGDPLFTDAANGDFTLQTGSPAINAGVDVGLTTDILGNPIVGNPDVGTYEKQ